ncbi:MAG: hypothetical protein ACXAD7_12480, partial [Candidatus Kariarchaeaceae archaeon]
LGDPDNVGDPTSGDSDGDGILDMWDPQRLISDYTPANITSDIEVEYTVTPGKTAKTIAKWFLKGLSTVWGIMKNIGNLFWDLLNSFWHWKKICIFKCFKVPWPNSWSTTKTNIKNAFVRFAKNSWDLIWPDMKAFGQKFWNTISLDGMWFKIKWRKGRPVGIDFSGTLKMYAKKVVDVITGIVDPVANIQFDIEDEAGIDFVKIYKDGALVKTKYARGRKSLRINENFKLTKSGFKLNKVNVLFEIHDINGNVRMIERTTTVETYGAALLKAGITFIKRTFPKLYDIISWAWDRIKEFLSAVADVIENIVKFVAAVAKKVLDWIKAQFDKIWEGFLRDTINVVLNIGKHYLDTADTILRGLTNAYLEARPTLVGIVDDFMDSPVIQFVNDSLAEVSDVIDDYLPPFDKDALKEAIGSVFGPVMDIIESNALLKFAYDILSGKALEILMDVFRDVLGWIFGQSIKPKFDWILEVVTGIFEQIQIELPAGMPIDMGDLGDGIEGLISMFVDVVDLMRNPAAAAVNLLSSITGEYILSHLDKFLVDNPQYIVSLNDILFTIFKPVIAVGVVAWDIFNFGADIISDIVDFFIPDVSVHVADLQKPSQEITRGMTLNDKPAKVAYSIVVFIGKLIDLVVSEIWRAFDAVDLASDHDLEKENIALKGIFGIFTWILVDVVDILDNLLNKGVKPVFSPWGTGDVEATLDTEKLGKDICFGVFKFFYSLAGIASAFVWKKSAEVLLTWIDNIITWVVNIVDAVWSTYIWGRYIAFEMVYQLLTNDSYVLTDKIAREFLMGQWELSNLWIKVFLDVLTHISEEGTFFWSKGPPGIIAGVIYTIINVVMALSNLAHIIVDGIFNWIEMAGEEPFLGG